MDSLALTSPYIFLRSKISCFVRRSLSRKIQPRLPETFPFLKFQFQYLQGACEFTFTKENDGQTFSFRDNNQ